MKIAVIGYSGSGKSVLSDMLGKKYNCPVLHLDQVNFTAGWERRPEKEALAQITEFLKNDSWVIDGNYSHYLEDRRLKEADKIIFMSFNRVACLSRCVKRYMNYYGAAGKDSRVGMAEDCPEKLDREFIMWILKDGRTSKKKRHYRIICGNYAQKLTVIKNQKQLDSYIQENGLK